METWYAFGAVTLVIGAFLYGLIRYHGLKGLMFGARISRTIGEIEPSSQGLARRRIRVHILRPKDSAEPKIGLEVTESVFLSWRIAPVSLSIDEARRLCDLLTESIQQWPTGDRIE